MSKTMVFFGAHPDDESFGPGSTLAQYAARGFKVYCVCSTGGEAGTVAPQYLKGYNSIAELRSDELKCAAQALGLAGVFRLGYRDSGMRGSDENKHPDALAMAPLEEVTGRIVKIVREIKPDVVITHDPGAEYGHPDHVATHDATVRAFYDSGDQTKYPEAGPVFRPGKLYFFVRPHGVMKTWIRLMPLFGQDPRHFGRNKDVDLTRMVAVEYPIHAVIHLSKQAVKARNAAAACHASQGGGRPARGPFRILRIMDNLRGPREYFMRGYPAGTRGHPERDVFEGLREQ